MSLSFSTDVAGTILEGFDKHYRLFREASADARHRFEAADWAWARQANRQRIDMYDARVSETVHTIRDRFPTVEHQKPLWPQIKLSFISQLYKHRQPDCAETFFNSVACRVLHRRYYNNEYIFWRPAVSTEYLEGEEPTYDCYYPRPSELKSTFHQILYGFGLRLPFRNVNADLKHLTWAANRHFSGDFEPQANFQIQVLTSLFFRNKAAYAVGRVLNGSEIHPFVVPILQDENRRLFVDTLLLQRRDIGRVLSLARAYFMVDMEVPSAYVTFLQSLLPTKPKAEFYTMLGLQKQGKTLLYRDLQQHLNNSTDEFVIAPGTRGMVMLVFTLPSFPYVFKVIRDWFTPPKDTDPEHVQDRYLLVKYHDRVGRMSDTLEYSHVAFPRHRFSRELLEEMQKLVPSSLEQEGDQIVIKHMYVERRMVPLDVYLQRAGEAELEEAIVEYGHAIKDMAGANIFPGDLLLKNFGVTRYGRVVFYDYDEICYLTDCNFRRLPSHSDDAETSSPEPWFSVDVHDVFPEQFPTFLFPEGRARELFLKHHGELADPRFWIEQQARIRSGVQQDVFPYPQDIRF